MPDEPTHDSMALSDVVHNALTSSDDFPVSVNAAGAIKAGTALPTADLFPMPSSALRIGVGNAMGTEGVQLSIRALTLRQASDLADRATELVEGLSAPTVAQAAVLPGGLSLSGPGGGRSPVLPEYDVQGRRVYAIHLRFVQQDTRPIQ